LVAIAELRHFGKAAEASFVSQPTLSAQLKKLEESLGVQLIERTSKGALLTRIGERVAERARNVLEEVAAMKELARNEKEPHSGPLTLGIFPTLGPYLLPHAVPNLRASFPKIELYLIEDKTDALIQRLECGSLDCAVLAAPVEHDALVHQYLFDEPFVLATPCNAPLTLSPFALDELRDRPLLLLEEGHCMRQHALEVCALSGARETDGFRATSLETLRQMVAAGVGSTLLPMLSVQPPVAPHPAIRLTRFAGIAPSRRLGLYWRKSSARGEFFASLSQVLAKLPEGILELPIAGSKRTGRRGKAVRSSA